MLVVAALVPETALLVPGAAGRADVLPEARAAALEAVQAMLAAGCTRVVVVAPGARDRTFTGPVQAGLGAAGIPDRWLGWTAPAGGGPTVGVAASVSLLLLARCGWEGPTDVIEVGPTDMTEVGPGAVEVEVEVGAVEVGRAARLRAQGAHLVGAAPTGLVVAGSLSARHGPLAPLAQDPRADAWDAAVLADLAAGSAESRARLARLAPTTAQELAVSGWGPWQVLLGAVDAAPDAASEARPASAVQSVRSDVRAVPSTGSAQYLAGTWRVVGAAPARSAPDSPAREGAVR